MKKRRIVIASVLKPVDDSRMCEKIGASLSSLYKVHLIGYPTLRDTPRKLNKDLTIIPLSPFSRVSIGRLLAPWRILKQVIRIRPVLFIACTHELLSIAVLARLITGCKIIYDVQENYARNVYHGRTVPAPLRLPVALYLRLKEWISSAFVHHYFLAEQCYLEELKFTRQRFTVLENKLSTAVAPSLFRQRHEKDRIILTFTGTLAITTGVFTAIELANTLHAIDKRISLRIVGHAHQSEMRNRIRRAIADKHFIELVGLDSLVPHAEVLKSIAKSDFGIIAYPPNISTQSSFPTKLFEYMGHELPILLINNPGWVAYCAPYHAALAFDPATIQPHLLLDEMMHTTFYSRKPNDVFWSSEEGKLFDSVEKVLADDNV